MSSPIPVIVGVAQLEQRAADPQAAKEPIELMIDAVRAAAEDAGSVALLGADSVRVIRGIWPYENPARAVAEAIGATGAETTLSPYGGNFVQTTLSLSAVDIQAGEKDIIVLTGAECGHSQAKAAKAGHNLAYQDIAGAPDRYIAPEMEMRHAAEKAIRLGRPVQVYPIFETALRAKLGHDIDTHQQHIAELWASFSAVAAQNPHAWLRDAKTAQEIRTLSDINRPVSHPYPKFMNSNSNVDQAAAIILCSTTTAQRLGIPEEKWVYPWAGTDAHDHYFVSNRDNLYSSPAIRIAGSRALEMAATEVGQLDHVDVYSCFPSSVQVAARELNLDTHKPLTITGGLTFAGGPMNNYVMHSIARMVELLRDGADKRGLITANGGYLTKHAFGVYSATPPEQPFQHADLQAEVDALPARSVVEAYTGTGSVEGYSVMYSAEGLDKAFVATRLEDGHRAWGVCNDRDVLQDMISQEYVGHQVRLQDHVATF
ncbi:MAG: acetyl-CoA acetyltransferase [Pseudomonadota bacterium]